MILKYLGVSNLWVLLLLFLFSLQLDNAKGETSSTLKYSTNLRIAGIEARGPQRLFYSVNILAPLSSSFSFPVLNDSKVSIWLLTRYTKDLFDLQQQQPLTQIPIKPLALYDSGTPAIRNQTIKSNFLCSPSESDCNQISIPSFDLKYIGVYTSISRSSDYLYENRVDYNVSTYALPLLFECNNSAQCNYNISTQTLSVLPDRLVEFSCSILIAQNDIYPIAADLNIYSELNGEECTGSLGVQLVNTSAASVFKNSNENYNVLVYKLTKTCKRMFSKNELTRSFSCVLNPKNQNTSAIELQKSTPYERLIVKLDINYGPDLTSTFTQSLNKTIVVGSTTTVAFACPFVGNPEPNFFWRIVSSDTDKLNKLDKTNKRILTPTNFSLSSKEYTVPSNLEVGTYVFECRAEVVGIINKISDPVQFYLNVIRKFYFDI